MRKLLVCPLSWHQKSVWSIWIFLSLSSRSMSFLPVWLLQVPHYLTASAVIHVSPVLGPLKEEAILPLISEKHLPRSLCVLLTEMKGKEIGFVTKATCWAGQGSCKTRKIFVVNTSAWLSSACLSVSGASLSGHLYNCDFTHARIQSAVTVVVQVSVFHVCVLVSGAECLLRKNNVNDGKRPEVPL